MPIFKGFFNKRIEVLNILKKKISNKHEVFYKTTMSYSTILKIFKDLLDNKLVERVDSDIDTRQHKYKLTDKGLELINMFK